MRKMVMMDSALGPSFSNFYIANLENKVFRCIKNMYVISMISSLSKAQMKYTIYNWPSKIISNSVFL